MNKDEQTKLKTIMMSFMDEFVQRYYVVEQPIIRKNDNISTGYRPATKTIQQKKRQSINFSFTTIQPSKKEIDNYINVWIQTIEI